jgi:hypothetical protein
MEGMSRLLLDLEALPSSLLLCSGAIITVDKCFQNKHCNNMATNVNSRNTRSKMEASSAGKHGYGDKGR